MLHAEQPREERMSLSMVGAVPGTLIVIGIVVLGVVLLGYAVYFLFFKKNLGSED
jgi:hypothetical protein